ncbi:hypothetical protein AVHM3334_02715 [Acidovorax sp. SUPP3334]|nr:hypothetical protein AVHM3334_02715 [Acidovorax sp. SUPP3334]
MRLRENAESIAFYRGESQERAQLDHSFQAVFNNCARLIKRPRSLHLFQRAFSQLTVVIPAVILADAVPSGDMEVGRAIQAAGAFAAVLAAVSLIVDNFESLSRFVAGLGRLDTLAQALLGAPARRKEPAEPEAVSAGRRCSRTTRTCSICWAKAAGNCCRPRAFSSTPEGGACQPAGRRANGGNRVRLRQRARRAPAPARSPRALVAPAGAFACR